MANDIKKILLVHLFANGDCLYATAVARQIKNDFPGCHLTWAIASFCKDIIALNPYVDDLQIVNDVPKNDTPAFRRYRKKVYGEKAAGKWSEVFITHTGDRNQGLYDGTVRGMILRAYPSAMTVPLQPVLQLSAEEKEKVAAFAAANKLQEFNNVILWEYAPQSGQSVLDFDFVMNLAKKIAAIPSTCIILSSANKFITTGKIIDGSVLSVRENAALTHYCSLLIGCSSGITWLSTSSAAKFLPMVQLLNPSAYFFNPPSVDFKRYDISTEQLIEIITINEEKVYNCIFSILQENFSTARRKYNNEKLPLYFNTTRKVVYNLACYMQFGAIAKHYRVITSVYGRNKLFLKEFWKAILLFPFHLVINVTRKRF